MNAEWLRTRGVVAAAVGAGILLGAAGILLYQQLMAEKKRLDRVASSVSMLRREIDHMKSDTRPAGRHGTRGGDARSMSDIDMFSTVSRLDEEDEDSEFFDLSDEDAKDDAVDTRFGAGGDTVALEELLNQVDALLVSGTSDEKTLAYHLLHEHANNYPSNAGVLWRLARAAHSMGNIMGPDMKKDFYFEGLEHAKAALALDDKDADAHKWFAITLGSCGDFLSTKEKIGNGYVFKQHVDRAIALRPSDDSLYHLLGRFQFEVASLSWLERNLAARLIAAPPEGSYEDARSHFLKCEELSPKDWKENRLFIAKCNIQMGQIPEGLRWLDRATEIQCVTPEDYEAETEIKALLNKYKSYRS